MRDDNMIPPTNLIPPKDQCLGLKDGTLKLEAYSHFWPIIYIEEEHEIKQLVRRCVHSVHHIGSTAVPGLAAKPIIDILIGLHDFSNLPEIADQLALLGYHYKGENGISGRHYFIKGNPRSFHIHMMLESSMKFKNHLIFRNTLRSNSELTRIYQGLKFRLLHSVGQNREKYTNGKNDFITRTLAESPCGSRLP